jgi:Ca2+-transporting ATPase
MTAQAPDHGGHLTPADAWYARSADSVTGEFDVDPAVGLDAARVAARRAEDGPNTLPEERTRSGWLRFLGQYTSYMQIILVASAAVSSPSRSGAPRWCCSA